MPIAARFEIRYGQATEAGRKPANQDVLGFSLPSPELQTTKGLALVIADGVSAAAAGREAAEICVQGFLSDYFSTSESWEVKTSAHRVLSALNRWLYREGREARSGERGYVCALSVVVVKSRTAHVFHVGDTRVSLWRDGSLEPITREHRTWLSRDRSVLSRAMGVDLHLEVDYHRLDLREGDGLLLTTDGVHDHLATPELAALLHEDRQSPEPTCEAILHAALQRGSQDNLSCQLIHFDALPEASRDELLAQLTRLPFPPPLSPGQSIDGYQIEQVLNESARSQIYLVRDTESGRQLAMKTPAPRFADDAPYIERFQVEEWAGRRLESPHLVRVVKKTRQPRFLYYLMEPVEGTSLGTWMDENPQPEVGRVVNIVQQLVEGLRALHRQEILHQDLKPDNILIRADGSVVIIDLGSVRIAGVAETAVPFQREERLGTRHYAAPEYLLGRPGSTRSDLFSLAVITYELFSGGKPPFGGKLAQAHSRRDLQLLPWVPVARHNPLIPIWIDGAVKKALSVEPRQRQEVLSEFLMELKRPNPAYLESRDTALIDRHPVRFWQSVSLALAGLVVLLGLLLLLR